MIQRLPNLKTRRAVYLRCVRGLILAIEGDKMVKGEKGYTGVQLVRLALEGDPDPCWYPGTIAIRVLEAVQAYRQTDSRFPAWAIADRLDDLRELADELMPPVSSRAAFPGEHCQQV